MTKKAVVSLVHLWVPASNVVSLLCFVKLLASSSQDARSSTRGSVVCHSEGSGGSLLSGKVCNTKNTDSVYKYLRTVNLFQSLLGAFLLSHAHLSSIISAVWHVLSFLWSTPIWHLLLLNICRVPLLKVGWLQCQQEKSQVYVYHLASKELWERWQWFGAVPWYNHLLYSAHKWEVILLSKVTRSTGKFMEKPSEHKQGRFSEIQNRLDCETCCWGTIWGQEPNKMQEGTGHLGSYQEYQSYYNSKQIWKEYIIHFTVLKQFLNW